MKGTKKANRKKLGLKRHCLRMAKEGFVNGETGKFIKGDMGIASHRGLLTGYKVR